MINLRAIDKEAGITSVRPTPKLSYIIVNKRINHKLYLEDRSRNPPPGTVTFDGDRSFFLIAQTGTQGVLTPSHYNIIFDDTNLDIKALAELTFRL